MSAKSIIALLFIFAFAMSAQAQCGSSYYGGYYPSYSGYGGYSSYYPSYNYGLGYSSNYGYYGKREAGFEQPSAGRHTRHAEKQQ
ncbi:unnamed protein product [Bursaphelenchus okinawaensis]|uniref:Uncharacterized protein n=1 Tax=Bursaphelenchus okinawaensis TaxID=465554 RepID=A0A811L0A7_9BILA|nr:unnamed protein product [Bursaphelenchus okinawaensis]CAG9115353.1 unnamed protein product [Bursaphelenchus okinawaensis]